MRRRRWLRRLGSGLFIVVAGVLVLTLLLVLPWRWFDPPTSAFMLQRQWQAQRAGEGRFAIAQRWVPLERISPQLGIAVVAAEDQKFPDHWGFDFESIRDAVQEGRRGEGQRGASTISQQVVKNLYLWPAASYLRKGIEAWLTLALETLWPKRRILEVYLNVAEFGDGLYGAEAAAQHYFARPAAALNAAEAALLAAVLPNPRRLRAALPSPYVRERQRQILQQMGMLGGPYYLHAILDP